MPKLLRHDFSAAQGELLAHIQSEHPTRYRLHVAPEGDVHVFCAFDALLYVMLTGATAKLYAQPPVGASFTVTLHPDDGPSRLALWHSLTRPDAPLPTAEGMPSNRCPYLHLFENRRDAERWRSALPTELSEVVEVISLSEAWQAARQRVDDLAGSSSCCRG